MKTIRTERLILRELKSSDAVAFYEHARNPNVGPAASWKPHDSLEESKEILERMAKSGEVWAIEEKSSGQFIGTIGLHEEEKRQLKSCRMLGYALSEPWWNRGYCTEAARAVLRYGFEDMELALITVNHFPFNAPSKRVIRKCGFKYEGTLRCAAVRYDGQVLDTCEYSITPEEFRTAAAGWEDRSDGKTVGGKLF